MAYKSSLFFLGGLERWNQDVLSVSRQKNWICPSLISNLFSCIPATPEGAGRCTKNNFFLKSTHLQSNAVDALFYGTVFC